MSALLLPDDGPSGGTGLLDAFRAVEIERGITPRTADERCRVLVRFAASLGDRRLLEATAEDIDAWLMASPVNEATRSTHRTSLRKFFDFCRRTGLRRDNPLRGVLRQAAPESMALVNRYIEHQRFRHLSETTTYRSLVVLRSLAASLDGSLHDATRDDIEAWLKSRKTTAKSRYTYISHIATFYRWAVAEELVERDPTLRLDRPRMARAVPRPMGTDDLRFALRAAEPRMHAWLALVAFQGFRCKEVVDLTVDDLMLNADPPAIVVSEGKGRRGRVLPLNPEVLAALRRYNIPRAGHIFCRSGSTEPMAPSTVSKYISVYLKEMGVPATAHQGRHWFGTNVFKLTKDLRMTQELMGHASPSTTAQYVAFSDAGAATAVQRLSSVALGSDEEGAAERIVIEQRVATKLAGLAGTDLVWIEAAVDELGEGGHERQLGSHPRVGVKALSLWQPGRASSPSASSNRRGRP